MYRIRPRNGHSGIHLRSSGLFNGQLSVELVYFQLAIFQLAIYLVDSLFIRVDLLGLVSCIVFKLPFLVLKILDLSFIGVDGFCLANVISD